MCLGQPGLQRLAVVLARVLTHRGECLVAGLQGGIDAPVLGRHVGEQLPVLLRTGLLRVLQEDRPEVVVLGLVVVVEGVGEPVPPLLQRGPHLLLGDRGVLHGGDEVHEVAAQGVVHDVHAGLVVRALGGVALQRQGQLRQLPGGECALRCASALVRSSVSAVHRACRRDNTRSTTRCNWPAPARARSRNGRVSCGLRATRAGRPSPVPRSSGRGRAAARAGAGRPRRPHGPGRCPGPP